MKKKTLKKIFISTLLTIWIGGGIIIATEIFILNGNKDISFSNIGFFNESAIKTQEVARLRNNHSRYMDEGIIPVTKTARVPAMPLPPAIEDTTERLALIDTGPELEFSLDDVITQQRDIDTIAQIEPASGVEGDYRPEINIAQNNPFEKTLNDVLADIAPESQITEEETTQLQITEYTEDVQNHAPDKNTEHKYIEPEGHGQIAIIIDDMGLSLRSKIIENMQAPLTLSYLPNAKNIKERTKKAKENGHEIMLHMPMEPLNTAMDDGSVMLRLDQSAEDFKEALNWSFERTDIFVGVNNHMGSKLTADKNSMTSFMRYLEDKGMFFIDSKTIGTTIAAETAQEFGIPYAERDVFLDHEITQEFIKRALRKTEIIAQKKGYAIAIAHPHKETIAALKKWIPTLKEKGLTLVPASHLIKQPVNKEPLLAAQ